MAVKSYAQKTKNYESEWKKIDELIQKNNLPQSALAEVKKVYALAKRERQDAQVVKSLVYMVGLQQQNREDNTINSIKEFEKEIAVSKQPVASILNSLLAGLFWQYFQNNRWQLYDRTNTVHFNKDDIATWTAEDLHKKISALYLQSIRNDSLLKQTGLESYNAIIIKGNVRLLRPALYDLLVHEALDYFKNDERDIKRPAYAFEIDQPKAFAPANEFVKEKFITNDSLSLHHKALLIYQELLAFHLKDAKPDALIDADIQRIEFVYQNSVSTDKDSLYEQGLRVLTSKYGNHPVAAQAWYLLAAYHEKLAALYEPLKDTAYRFERLKAKEILEKVVNDSTTKSEGWVNSYNLLSEITKPLFSFEVEKVNVPAKPFLALVKYRNVNAVNFRLIKADEAAKKLLDNRYYDKFWNALSNIKPIKEWQQSLPATNDLQEHAVEIKVDALPVGEYMLLATNKNDAAVQLLQVSNISYVQHANQYFVLNRENGQPLPHATVQVFSRQYDYRQSKYVKARYASYQADRNGFFQIERKKSERGVDNAFALEITYDNDHLFLDEYNYTYYSYSERKEQGQSEKIFFFTDRSIYRPGQTVFFKGIVVDQREIVPAYNTTIFLLDANSQKVDSLNVVTNEFGSFSGKFTLPQNLLNGEFVIVDKKERDRGYFSVEEYKRPKFYVEFDQIKQSYKVGDSIAIKGNAKAYAGNNVSGAKVVYRVVRQPRFLYPWLLKGWWPRIEPMEIAHGEIATGENGQFTFTFKAIPDLKLNKNLDPVFDYEISADITDINGETRSGEMEVTAGYKPLLLKVKMDERIAVDSLKNIFIRTENMVGEYQPSIVKVSLIQLIPENRLIRNRYWQQPDQFVMSKEVFIQYFPNDEYNDESNYRNWTEGKQVFEKTDSSKINGQWTIGNQQLSAGFYKVEISTKDKEGTEVKDIRFIELFDPKSNRLSKPDYLWTKGSGGSIEPGEKTVVQIGTTVQNVFLIGQIDKNTNEETGNVQPAAGNFSFYSLNNEKKSFEFAAKEEDRGGYGVTFFFVRDNRLYQFNDVINVPWSNKELKIEYATYRDKTLPGSEEKWKVKITGSKGDKAAAEMLASMYDASLDQFNPHNWQKPVIWPVYAGTYGWNGSANFSFEESFEKPIKELEARSIDKSYDQLMNYRVMDKIYEDRKRKVLYKLRLENQAAEKEVDIARVPLPTPNKVGVSNADSVAVPEIEELKDTKIDFDSSSESQQEIREANFQIRKNFNETAFFFPDLRTDKDGNIEFSFTMPEALTRWKLQTFAHRKDLAMGLAQTNVITQKELMVQPNAPRFLRQGDALEFSAKIVNLSDKELTGQAELQLLDATTNQPVDGWFQNIFPNQYFTVSAGGSEVVKFPIEVPYQFNNALVWRVVAKAGNYSDGEEMTLPVLTNKTLVTETLPLMMKGSGSKNFTFDKLLQAGNSESLQHQSLTVEFTSNPAWYAVQALPYLMEYPYECAEQIFNRYYANALAAKIASASPRIKQIFERWKTADSSALQSNLQKNQELKSVLLEETPWVLQAKSEEQQKKNLALLFDLVRMSNELKSNIQKLKEMQSENGGFVWFKGGPDDQYITQYILTGIGHLKKLNALTKEQLADWDNVISQALLYLDRKSREDCDYLVKRKLNLSTQHIGYLQAQYLYMRSFFPEHKLPQSSQAAYNYYQGQAKQFWMNGNKYMQGMIALALNRRGDQQTPKAILKSLKETAIFSDELGMYWKGSAFRIGWFWWQSPIETQSLLIEAFAEISNDTKTINDLKTWLLRNKQTTNWRTTKATADACYALLLQGSDWLNNESQVAIQLGNTTVAPGSKDSEAGSGYFKKVFNTQIINPQMGNITVSIKKTVNAQNPEIQNPSYGSIYWQYFEDLDKITPASTPLQLNKKLFVEKNSDNGPVLTPIGEGSIVKVGDKIKVRIELRVDRDMEYVHMKDMRASALEPVHVLSGYKWQGGLGYYESTKDASTNFFFNYLRKGTYVFEYPLFVTHAGNFSNGVTTIQCMYAPEFSAHSEGVKLRSE
ncbi:MG2 domain-containing protein [Chitinophagaceae bacterium LB-8]|uniref:MG2 domain-containing protein n=1 Tax=Paraflavisolibacter caeni TaxID=2982496 RepID=A0A9X2XTP0_9BACT|nr:alpha-2-macroglobulin family protein [Paraflavisolibacter caeni]MCU7548625.1 MG2 domain-containing protein [Paraflavisolibacter caeni]